MFSSNSFEFNSSNHSLMGSFSSCDSASSYESSSSDTSGMWPSTATTPVSSPQRHDSLASPCKVEESYAAIPMTYSPSRPSSMNDFYSINPGNDIHPATQELMGNLQAVSGIPFRGNETPISNPSFINFDYNNYSTSSRPSFETHHGLPLLEMDIATPTSVSSSMNDDFVDPSQTLQFMDTIDMHSPFRQTNMHVDLHYSPESEYNNFIFHSSPSPSSIMSCFDESKPLRQRLFQPLESSAILQRMQSPPPPPFLTIKRSSTTRRDRSDPASHKKNHLKRKIAHTSRQQQQQEGGDNNNSKANNNNNNVAICKKAVNFCRFPNCGNSFQRPEHLKRHERIHYSDDKFPCPFCERSNFSRTDNLKSHVKLHAFPKKGSRTKYHPDALPYWQNMAKKCRKVEVMGEGELEGEGEGEEDLGDGPGGVDVSVEKKKKKTGKVREGCVAGSRLGGGEEF